MAEQYHELLQAAKKVRENSYSPFSKFKVGAALLSRDGKIYVGTNVENVSFSAGICAERAALSAAIADGKRKFTAIAIYADKPATPCGICRQVLMEFGDIWVITASDGTEPRSFTLSKLLPEAFTKF